MINNINIPDYMNTFTVDRYRMVNNHDQKNKNGKETKMHKIKTNKERTCVGLHEANRTFSSLNLSSHIGPSKRSTRLVSRLLAYL